MPGIPDFPISGMFFAGSVARPKSNARLCSPVNDTLGEESAHPSRAAIAGGGSGPRFRGIADPRHGDAGWSMALQRHCAAVYDWSAREAEWRRLIAEITACR